MSTQINSYIMYGYCLNYDEAREALLDKLDSDDEKLEELFDLYSDSAFDKKIVKVNGCSMICDYMGGQTIFFGKIYAKSDNHEPLETQKIKKPKKLVREKIAEEFKAVFGSAFSHVEPSLYVVSNYR